MTAHDRLEGGFSIQTPGGIRGKKGGRGNKKKEKDEKTVGKKTVVMGVLLAKQMIEKER